MSKENHIEVPKKPSSGNYKDVNCVFVVKTREIANVSGPTATATATSTKTKTTKKKYKYKGLLLVSIVWPFFPYQAKLFLSEQKIEKKKRSTKKSKYED